MKWGIIGTPTSGMVLDLHPSNTMIFQRELVVLSKGMALPILGAKNPSQIRMVQELYSDEIIRFTLVPVSDAPDLRHAGNLGQITSNAASPTRQLDFELTPVTMCIAIEVIHNLDVRISGQFFLGIRFQPIGS